MKNIIQSQIKDQVINYLWNRIIKLSNNVIKLEQENNILKYNLIESLKHVFLIKSQFNISSPLERILNNQNINQKNKIYQSVLESYNEINNLSYNLNPNNIRKNFHQKIKKAMTPYNNYILGGKKSKSVYGKNNSLNYSSMSSPGRFNKSTIYNIANIDKEESNNCSNITLNKNYNFIDNNTMRNNNNVQQKKTISINSTCNSTRLRKNRNKNNTKQKAIFRRDSSFPKLPLSKIINFNG